MKSEDALLKRAEAAEASLARLVEGVLPALDLAQTICDAVPTRLHENRENTQLANLGRLVNAQPDGSHGYALIRDARQQLLALLPAKAEADCYCGGFADVHQNGCPEIDTPAPAMGEELPPPVAQALNNLRMFRAGECSFFSSDFDIVDNFIKHAYGRACMALRPYAEGMVEVCKEDANNYCRILTLLGMEEEGDPVAEVESLISELDHGETVLRVQKALGITDTGWVSPDVVLEFLRKVIERATSTAAPTSQPAAQSCPPALFADAIARLAAHDAPAARKISDKYLASLAASQPQPVQAELSDAQIVEVLASLGIDAEKSKYGFDTLQVRTTVPRIRDIVKAILAAAKKGA